MCVPGHDPLMFSFLSFLLFDWVGGLWPQLSKVLTLVLISLTVSVDVKHHVYLHLCAGLAASSFPTVPAEAGRR